MIRSGAGASFNKYGVAHAGLGVWDTTTDDKYTIEFVSNSYVGALLPNLTDNDISWNNAATVSISDLNENDWLNSRLITTTSGSVYSQLITYLQNNRVKYSVYQPITSFYLNFTELNTSKTYTTDDIQTTGDVLVKPINSFSFVDDLVQQLSNYGCDMEAFLNIYATSFNYVSGTPEMLTPISWPAGQPDQTVYSWYSNLTECYNQKFNISSQSEDGAQDFLVLLKECYPPNSIGYFYQSATSVYAVSS